MFKVTLALLLFGALVATVKGADLCCSEIQKSLEDHKAKLEDMQGLVKDLYAKLENEFKWPPSPKACPLGFTYLPLAKSCYKVVYESHDWTSAGKRCQALRRGSNLAAITNEAQNNALKTFLAFELSTHADNKECIASEIPEHGSLFWTSGQREIENSCKSPFVWKPSSDKTLPFGFTYWLAGQPDCQTNSEFCMDIWPIKDFRWNDLACGRKICPLCEYKPE